jgi:hypothetical protein
VCVHLTSVAPNGSSVTSASALLPADATLSSTTDDEGIGPTQSWHPDSIDVQLTVGHVWLPITTAFAVILSPTDARLNGGALPDAPPAA